MVLDGRPIRVESVEAQHNPSGRGRPDLGPHFLAAPRRGLDRPPPREPVGHTGDPVLDGPPDREAGLVCTIHFTGGQLFTSDVYVYVYGFGFLFDLDVTYAVMVTPR